MKYLLPLNIVSRDAVQFQSPAPGILDASFHEPEAFHEPLLQMDRREWENEYRRTGMVEVTVRVLNEHVVPAEQALLESRDSVDQIIDTMNSEADGLTDAMDAEAAAEMLKHYAERLRRALDLPANVVW